MKFMVKSLRVKSYAKLNLYLEVLNKRPDGYHNIRTVFERISLADTLIIREKKGGGISIISDSKDIPLGRNNLVYKAADLIKNKLNIDKGVAVEIIKKIPVGAGLGGGSSNAAGCLLGLNRLWDLRLSRKRLLDFAAQLGSDVAFFLYKNPYALGVSRGEKIRPIQGFNRQLWHVLVYPGVKVSTKDIYQEFYRRGLEGLGRARAGRLDLKKTGLILFNNLEEAVFRKYPRIRQVKDVLLSEGVNAALMSGSGSAVFGVVNSRKEGLRIAGRLKRKGLFRVYVVNTQEAKDGF